ncbi:MAG: hypothetical protein AAF494_12985 [Pseudomonadota bacterium]
MLFIALAIGLLGILQLFYGTFYSIHPDLAGGALSGRLAVTLGDAFAEYSLYFPPAEKAWFSLAARLSELTGLRLDLAIVLMTSTAVLFSGGLAYRIRQESVGATPLFLIVSVGVLVTVPIVFMNVFGLREHLVVLGLWPYFVLRISDHDDAKIGWRTRLVLGLWLGATLLFKYLYSLVVLLVELADAAVQRRPWAVLRVENLVSGAIVALYLFFWLVLDPSQREAIAVVVSAIDANLTDHRANLLNAAVNLALAIVFLLIARIFKLPARTTLIGLAMVVGAVIAAWIQSRWYIQHLLPVTMAYIAWWWMARGKVATLWVVALALLIAPAIFGAFIRTGFYQATVQELDTAIDQAGLSVEGKRVGVLIMNPSPLNQYLASSGAWRWNVSVNNSYVAAELYHLDKPENIGIAPPPVKLDVPGRKKLHDDMLRLWEDMPPDVLILDHSRSWPLNYVEVKWTQVFSEDQRFRAFLAQYRPVLHHDGDLLDFKYYVRKD